MVCRRLCHDDCSFHAQAFRPIRFPPAASRRAYRAARHRGAGWFARRPASVSASGSGWCSPDRTGPGPTGSDGEQQAMFALLSSKLPEYRFGALRLCRFRKQLAGRGSQVVTEYRSPSSWCTQRNRCHAAGNGVAGHHGPRMFSLPQHMQPQRVTRGANRTMRETCRPALSSARRCRRSQALSTAQIQTEAPAAKTAHGQVHILRVVEQAVFQQAEKDRPQPRRTRTHTRGNWT